MIPTVTQALTSLARLTLRQLRQMASDLGVTLYSRKSKDALVSEIAERQERKSGDQKAIESELSAPTRSTSSTRVVFLPRDPQWATCSGKSAIKTASEHKLTALPTSAFVWLM